MVEERSGGTGDDDVVDAATDDMDRDASAGRVAGADASDDDPTGGARRDPTGDGPTEDDPDDAPAPRISARTGWVVAAFLLFWPLAIPALVFSAKAVRNTVSADLGAARRASRRALGFAVAGICTGTLILAGGAGAVAMAPAWLPDGAKEQVRAFVPPAVAEAAGIDPWVPEGAGGAPSSSDPASPVPPGDAGEAFPTDLPTSIPSDSGTATDDVAEWWAAEGRETTEEDPAEDPSRTKPVDLEVGDCLDTEKVEGIATLYWIPVLACEDPHGGEVFATTRLADAVGDDGPPTQQRLWKAADAYCYPEFESFVGEPWAASDLVYWPVAPSEESWEEGDRKVACIVESRDEPVTGTLRDAGR